MSVFVTMSPIKVIPNVLSSMRMALSVIFPFLPDEWRLPALVAGALSDWADGLIARRYQAITSYGTMLDAIADKMFTVSVLLTIAIAGEVTWWQIPLVLARDLAVLATAAYCIVILKRMDAFRHMRPRLPGKITTTIVFLWLIAVLVQAPQIFAWLLFSLAAACSAIAAVDYLTAFGKALRKASFQQNASA